MANPIYITTQDNYDKGGDFSSFYFDTVTDFKPTYNSRMTKYAISDKSQITNHTTKENLVISMSAIVSASPINKYNNNLVTYTKGRVVVAYNLLTKWYDEKTDLFIDEGNRQYTRLNIVSLEPYEDGTEGMIFDIKLEQARRVGYQTVTLVNTMDGEKSIDATGNSTKKAEKSTERTSQLSLLAESLSTGTSQLLGTNSTYAEQFAESSTTSTGD